MTRVKRRRVSMLAPSPVITSALLLGLAAVASTVYRLADAGRGDSLGSLLVGAAMVFASVGFITAARRTSGDARRSWSWLAAGAVVYLLGELVWALQSELGGEPPGISVADLFWLGALPLWFAGLQVRAREDTPVSARGEGVLDALIIVGFFGIVIGRFLMQELFGPGVPFGEGIVGLAYPVADLALLWMLLRGIYRTNSRWNIEQGLLALGLVALVVGDVLWAAGTADFTAIPDLAYIGAGLALGGAGFVASNSTRRGGDVEAITDPPRPLVIDLMPYIAGIGAVAVAFWLDLSGEGDAAVSLAAGSVLLLVFARLGLTVRQNRRLREAAEEQALFDPVTRLRNHRYFEERLGEELAGARRGESSVGLLMIDIDRFKAVNDTIGHLGGDRLLGELGEVLRKNSRPDDSPCRIGGDEFAVILPGLALGGLGTVAHRILAAAAEIRLAAPEDDVEGGHLRISVSIGGCSFPAAAADQRALVENADVALYRSKREGRGRVTVFDPGFTGPAGPDEALAAAERKIKEREVDLSLVFGAAPDPLLVLSPVGGILDANLAACGLSGLSVAQMRERTVWDFLHERDVERVAEMLAGNEPGREESGEIEITLSDGSSRWLEFHATEFPPDRSLLALRDVTDRHVAVAELALSEEKFHSLFESAGDAIYVLDDYGTIKNANHAAAELAGISREQLIGAKLGDLMSGEQWQELETLMDGLVTDGSGAQGIFEGTWPDGSRRAVEFSSVANFVPGQHLTIVRDVTEQVGARRER